MQCYYNKVNFLPNPQNRHPISLPCPASVCGEWYITYYWAALKRPLSVCIILHQLEHTDYLYLNVLNPPVSSVRLLSHPVLGWLYVFSPFPPRPRPPPPPQKLFPLTSKPFELNLWYLAKRIYGSGELYWMTFPWPWPKVTAVASISQNMLVCAIKWEPLIGSLQNVAALLH